MKMAQRILSIVGGTFLFQHCTRADYTCGTNNCWNAEGDCCRDTSLLYSGRDELDALAQFFEACNGQYWLNYRNWCAGKAIRLRTVTDDAGQLNEQCEDGVITDPCTGVVVQYPVGWTGNTNGDRQVWTGLTCTGANVIDKVEFIYSQENITGDLSVCVGNFSALSATSTVDLSGLTGVYGGVPPSFGAMSSLTTLTLDSMGLDGTISEGLGSADLTSFKVHNNPNLHGTIPSDLGLLTGLTSLQLDSMALSGPVPSELGLLTALTSLQLQKNFALSGTLPQELSQLTSLTGFYININAFSGPLPSFANASGLSDFQVQKNHRLSGPLPEDFLLAASRDPTTSGVRVMLQYNRFTGTLPAHLGNFASLSRFSVNDNNFTGFVPDVEASSKVELEGSGNHWLCPFPSATSSILANALLAVSCTCPAGSSCNGGTCRDSCATCPDGTYSNATDVALSCTQCPAGRASDTLNGVSTNGATTEGGATALYSGGATSCGLCRPGYVSPSPGLAACEPCSAGESCATSGLNAATTCPAGTYSAAAAVACTPCAAGTYQASSGQSACTECSAGSSCPTTGLTAQTTCAEGSTSASGATACVPNPTPPPTLVPSSSPTVAPTRPTQVPTYAPTLSPTLEPTPQPTPAPSTAPSSLPSLAPTLTPTSSDTVVVTVSLAFTADASTTVTEDGVRTAVAGNLGGASVVRALSLSYVATRRRRLEGGMQRDSDAQGDSSPESGKRIDPLSKRATSAWLSSQSPPMLARFLGSTTASFEVVGSLADLGYTDAGSFEAAIDSSLSTAIDDGSITTSLQTSCGCTGVAAASVSVAALVPYPTLQPTPLPTPYPTPACGVGQYYSAADLACAACPGGRYQNQGNLPSSSCVACGAGAYSAPGAANCTLCAPGAYASAVVSTSCTACTSGTFSASAGAASCTTCDGGYFADEAGSFECTKCPNGTASTTDKTSCTVCAPGSFAKAGKVANAADASTTASGCTACPSGHYQPDAHQSSCLACESKSDDVTTYVATGVNDTAGTGATSCDAISLETDFLDEPWVRTAAASATVLLACALVCCVGGRCLTSTSTGKRCRRWACGGKGGRGGYHSSDSDTSSSEDDDEDGSLYLSRGREGRYTVTSKVLEVFDAPSLNARRVGPPKERGDELIVEANSDDWLLLADNEGWVLGFHPARGARVAKVRNTPSPRTGKTTKSFKSAVHDHLNQPKRRTHGSNSSSSSNLVSQKGSSSSSGKGGATKRASALGGRLLGKSRAYQPEVKRNDATAGGAGGGGASGAYYAVVVEDGDLLAVGGAPAPPPPTSSSGVSGRLTRSPSRSRSNANNNSDADGLSHFKRAAQVRAAAANVPQPATSINPYKLMPTQVYSGSDDVLLEDAPLPPPRPPGNPPRMVPRELFEDGQQTTYEVQYHKVRVRAEPTLRAKCVDVRHKGDIVIAEAENRFWVRIAPAPHKNQKGGWMLRDQKGFGPLLQLVAVEVWREYRDPGSGKPYWVNKATKEATWRHPDKRPPPRPPPTTLHHDNALTVANPMLAAKKNAAAAAAAHTASSGNRRSSGSGLTTVGRRRQQEQHKRGQTPPRHSPTSPPEPAQSTTPAETGKTRTNSISTHSYFWPQGSTPTGSDGDLSESESRDHRGGGRASPPTPSLLASSSSFLAAGLLPPAPPSAAAEASAKRAAQEETHKGENAEDAELRIKPPARRASFSEQFTQNVTESWTGAVGSLGDGFNALAAQSTNI